MLSREEIISSYKQAKFPTELFDESISKIKNIILYDKSTHPSSEKIKDTQKLSESYVLPRRILIQKNIQPNQNNKNEFIRGGNFTPKEPIIDIEIENIKLIYDKFSLPLETNIIYLKNTYGGINGPFNFEHIKNMYKNKKIDSNNDFRLIDIFCFRDTEFFSFQSLKIINDKKWIDSIINYSELFKYQKKEEKKKEIVNEIKEIEPKIEESEGKWEVAKKKKKVKSKEIKEEKDKKNEKEENKKEKKENVDSSEKLDIKINKEKKENNEELVEILKRKQKEKEKEKQMEEKKNQEK